MDRIINLSDNFWQWISWLLHRWRTQQIAITNVNRRILWIIKTLNALCSLSSWQTMPVWELVLYLNSFELDDDGDACVRCHSCSCALRSIAPNWLTAAQTPLRHTKRSENTVSVPILQYKHWLKIRFHLRLQKKRAYQRDKKWQKARPSHH